MRAVIVLCLFSIGCGKVERAEEVAPCEAYCDTVIDECGFDVERVDCDFTCDCQHSVVQPEVADDFIECLAALPCDATDPQQICALTVGARIEGEPSPDVLEFIADCENRLAKIGPCELELPCDAAAFLIDTAIPDLRACLTAPDCVAVDECVAGAFFLGCLDPG